MDELLNIFKSLEIGDYLFLLVDLIIIVILFLLVIKLFKIKK